MKFSFKYSDVISIYSKILSLDITWIFKIVLPIFYALIPVALYQIFKKQTNTQIAFLSCFIFIAYFKFYTSYLGRQGIAELFLVLILLLMFESNMKKINISILFIIFGISLAVSHYGLAYIMIFGLIMLIIVRSIFKRLKPDKDQYTIITSNYILFLIIFTFGWYMYTSNSSAISSILNIGNHISQTLLTEFFDVNSSQSLNLLTSSNWSFLHTFGKYIHLLIQLLIAIGFVVTLKVKQNFKKDYLILSSFFISILIASFFVPYLAGALNTDRLYQISLIFLAPFSVIGGLFLIEFILKLYKTNERKRYKEFPLKIMAIIAVIFFLINVGFIYEIANDYPTSIAISQNTVKNSNNTFNKAVMFQSIYEDQDFEGIKWLSDYRNNNTKVFGDYNNRNLIFRSYGMMNNGSTLYQNITTQNSYIYLGSVNILFGIAYDYNNYYSINYLFPQINESNKIYDNGNSNVLFSNSPSKIRFEEVKLQ